MHKRRTKNLRDEYYKRLSADRSQHTENQLTSPLIDPRPQSQEPPASISEPRKTLTYSPERSDTEDVSSIQNEKQYTTIRLDQSTNPGRKRSSGCNAAIRENLSEKDGTTSEIPVQDPELLCGDYKQLPVTQSSFKIPSAPTMFH